MGKFWILPASALMIAAFLLVPGSATPASATSPNGPTLTPVVKTTATTAPATTATATAPAAATGTGQPTFVPTAVVGTGVYQPGGGPFGFAHTAFQRVWNRTDLPVKMGQVSRTWFWGPGPNTPGLFEQYNEAPNGSRQRLVQYFDKSRMEVNDPQADPNQPFFVTNGLLTVELISGYIQVGEKDFVKFRPAASPCRATSATYRADLFPFQGVSNTQAGDHPSPTDGPEGHEAIDHNRQMGN